MFEATLILRSRHNEHPEDHDDELSTINLSMMLSIADLMVLMFNMWEDAGLDDYATWELCAYCSTAAGGLIEIAALPKHGDITVRGEAIIALGGIA